jgi:hypothetical protein
MTETYLQHTYGDSGEDAVNITVHDLHFDVEIVLGQSMLFAYTFPDQLRVVCSFDDEFEEPLNIKTYLNGMQKFLADELLGWAHLRRWHRGYVV